MFNQTVPDWLVGVWKRLSIEENGDRDTTTQATWIQTISGFADIRIPANRTVYKPIVRCGQPEINQPLANRTEDFLASLTPQQAKSLSQQEGFAGITQFAGGFCEWQRALDYAPFTGKPDQGRLHWEGNILVEIGPAGAYREEWQRLASGPTITMTATNEYAWEKWLVTCGDYFIYMCDRRPHLPANTTLKNLLSFNSNGTLDIASQQYLNCEVSLGRITAGNKAWEIQQSTLPWKEGDRLWNPADLSLDRNNNKATQITKDNQTLWDVQEWGNLEQLLQQQPIITHA